MTLTRELRLADIPKDLPADAPLPVTIATETPVDRWGVQEVLDCTAAGVDLSRAPLSLIIAHDTGCLAVGVVEGLSADGARVAGLARFGTSPEAQQIRADVLAGIHRYLSVGYKLLDEGSPIEGGLKFRWQPFEVSIVPVPADPASGFFRSLPGVHSMNTSTQTRDADAINQLCLEHRVPEIAQGLNARAATIEQARAAVVEELARRDQAAGGHLNVRGSQGGTGGERDRILNSLVQRMGGRVQGEVIRSADMVGIARRALELGGQRVYDDDSRASILHRALTTSDYPNLLGTAVGRVLMAAYEESPAVLKRVARKVILPDFRDKTTIRLGPNSALLKTNEHGEFKYGSVEGETKNTWKLSTWGRIISITRQALINDDLGGFNSVISKFGQAAARLEADQLVSILTAPPNVDAAALFATTRNNLITGAGSALQLSSLSLAVQSLRAQKDLDGGLVMQEPAFLVVPAALETIALQLVAALQPAAVTNVQPFKLDVIVEPRLDAISATAWYLVAGNQSSLEYGYLEGNEGVQTFTEEGFEIDGLAIKARLDFGAGWVAPIGWVKGAGA